MRICVITAETTGKFPRRFLGVVVGASLEEGHENARRKWPWYKHRGNEYIQRLYPDRPRITTRWMIVDDAEVGLQMAEQKLRTAIR